ncbi:MAG: hypothetical protein ACK4NF_02930 [Planctomycetota bacterium]
MIQLPGTLQQSGSEGWGRSILGIKIDEGVIDTLNVSMKKGQIEDRLFPLLFKLLDENYKSLVCNSQNCKPILLYIKYYLAYGSKKYQVPKGLFNKFIKYIEQQLAVEVNNFNKSKGVYDINKVLRLIMMNPYSKDIERLVDTFIKGALEGGSFRLIEHVVIYLNMFRIRVAAKFKRLAKFANAIAPVMVTTGISEGTDKEGKFRLAKLFRLGEIFTGENLCKEEKQGIDFNKLYQVLEYPEDADPSMVFTQGSNCFNIRDVSNVSNVMRSSDSSCNDVAYFIYKNSDGAKTNIANFHNTIASTFLTFKPGVESFLFLLQLPPMSSGGMASKTKESGVVGVSSYEWAKFSKTLVTRNSIVFSGNTLDNLSLCRIHDSMIQKQDVYVNNNCVFFNKKAINYEKYFVLEINYSEISNTLYALLAVEESENTYKLILHAFNVPRFSLVWRIDIATYLPFSQPPVQWGWWGGGGSYPPDIPRHSIIFSAKGDIIIVSPLYFISIDKQTGLINYVRYLNSRRIMTSFKEPLIIYKNINEILYLGPDSALVYHLNIESGEVLKSIDLSEGKGGNLTSGYNPILFVAGITNNLLVYYFHTNYPYSGQENTAQIRALDLTTLKVREDVGIPAGIFSSSAYGQITFFSMGCNYMFVGTTRGVMRFTSDIKKGKLLSGAEPAPIAYYNKNNLSTSVIPDYTFSYGNFLFVITKNKVLILKSKKK